MKAFSATHQGILKIGNIEIPCAVLEDGSRVLTATHFLQALGRPYKGNYKKDKYPAFISSPNLTEFVTPEIENLLQPIAYKYKSESRVRGYKAELLPHICSIYISAERKGQLDPSQKRIADQCEILLKGFATVGIIALIDEATGFQEDRKRDALQAILEKYLRKEFAAWAKRFPDEFYRQIFRLHEWCWTSGKVNKPSYVGKITNDVVYERLAPNILEELQKINPKDEKGNRKTRHHQWLTEDLGHPALAQHLHAIIALMKASTSWKSFIRLLEKAFPKKNIVQLEFDFDFDD
ncbi:MAG: P63C domain-containing protein [Candidatus Riflebacteria bacterium]|nr:P63C domain-containing protein [Candidatus Riflebacteria bacterium]